MMTFLVRAPKSIKVVISRVTWTHLCCNFVGHIGIHTIPCGENKKAGEDYSVNQSRTNLANI